MVFRWQIFLLVYGVLATLLGAGPLVAQSVQTQRLRPTDPAHLYRTRKARHDLTCYVLPAASATPRGVLLLLPGFGGQAESVFKETTLGQEAARAGLVTVVPTLNNRLYLDSAGTRFLDQVLRKVQDQYPSIGRTLLLGGFSAGGHLALSYAESLVGDTTRLPLRVKAVFGIDPPVDLAAFWRVGQRRIGQQCSPLLVREGQSIVATLTQAFGGSPEQVPAAYRQYSAFSGNDPNGGNLALLSSTPVRVYCEPDLAFWRRRYCPTLQREDLNAATLQPLIECLRRQGNTQAQYLETQGRGQVGKQPFPHAWSIVDTPECLRWLQTYVPQ